VMVRRTRVQLNSLVRLFLLVPYFCHDPTWYNLFMRYTSTNVEETAKLAEDFAKSLGNTNGGAVGESIVVATSATVVGLYGDLGSGKTTFMQGVGAILRVVERMVSPTFVIEKIYKIEHSRFTHLIHIDAYRMEKEEELIHLGWQEIIGDPHNLVCIEWPERVSKIMPAGHIKINFTFVDEHTRAIEFENYEIGRGEEK